MRKIILNVLVTVGGLSQSVTDRLNGEVGVWFGCFLISTIVGNTSLTFELHTYFDKHIRQKLLNFGWVPHT